MFDREIDMVERDGAGGIALGDIGENNALPVGEAARVGGAHRIGQLPDGVRGHFWVSDLHATGCRVRSPSIGYMHDVSIAPRYNCVRGASNNAISQPFSPTSAVRRNR
ncbi:hypothetical protein MMAGJ_51950 [Mycolicibacterium mageritense]|uniref:Uncharacterized protein n=1 Tax=Mycolicibacterium mageritense TaxID=53462 RepID=A0ABN5YCQ6_MYCME|nr:hypothetical protein MMAGJ_51950 [Mycolicibacterium mageritense]